MVRVKICGITSEADAELCVDAGADAIGLNFYAGSPRCVDAETARRIVAAIAGRTLAVGVFVDAGYDAIAELRERCGLGCVQLHGDEPPELLARFLPHAYKAVRVAGPAVAVRGARVRRRAHPARRLRARRRRRHRRALRLEPRRGARARAQGHARGRPARPTSPRRLRPCSRICVDVASGVESAPGRKDERKVRAFIAAAKAT